MLLEGFRMSEPNHNPFETPRPGGMRLLQGTLRVVVACQCFGLAAARLHQQRPDLLCEFVGKARNIPADQIGHIANLIAYGLIVCGVITLLRPATFVLLPVTIYQAALPVAILMQSSGLAARLAPALHATAIVVPLALLFVDFWPPRLKPGLVSCLAAVSFLKLGSVISLTGWSILFLNQCQHGGPLAEQLQQILARTMDRALDLDQARAGLGILGAISAALALSLLSGRNRPIAACAALFGLGLAASETLAHGSAGYDLTLMRLSEAGAPLGVLVFWMNAVREQKVVYIAEAPPKAAATSVPKPMGKVKPR
jgi:hypothetical protein